MTITPLLRIGIASMLVLTVCISQGCNSRLNYYYERAGQASDSFNFYKDRMGRCCDSVWIVNYEKEQYWIEQEIFYHNLINSK